MTTTAFEDHLRSLWNQNTRDLAVTFFRDAIHGQLTLRELESVLNCDMVKSHLADITLGQVLGGRPAAPTIVPTTPAPEPKIFAAPQAGGRGGRRSRQPMDKMRHLVVCALQEVRDGLTTTEVAARIGEALPDADPARAIVVLRHLEAGDQVVGDRSRPRRWRLKNTGRRVPEPIIIRKAAVVEAEAEAKALDNGAAPPAMVAAEAHGQGPAGVNGGNGSELLSQAEIQRAAQQLHERFFATHKRA